MLWGGQLEVWRGGGLFGGKGGGGRAVLLLPRGKFESACLFTYYLFTFFLAHSRFNYSIILGIL